MAADQAAADPDAGAFQQHGPVQELHAGIDGLDGGGRGVGQGVELQDGADQGLDLQRVAELDVLESIEV